MELKYYLSVLWRRKWVIVLTTIVTIIVAAFGSSRMTPQYTATAILWVPASHGGGTNNGDILLNDRLISTYIELVTSGPVVLQLERQLDIPAAKIRSATSADSIAQTELMKITVQDPNPQLAAAMATGLAQIVIEQTQRTDAGRQLRVSLFAPAGVPTDPTWLGITSTSYWREIYIGLGFIMGIVAGLALAFIVDYLDTTLYTRKEIEGVTELTTLVEVPVAKKRYLVHSLNGNSLNGEAFRHLRTNILFDQNALRQTLLITSAMPGEGKTTITANLASAIAQAQRKVIVLDANLRAPTLHTIFKVSNDIGLSNLLRREATLAEALQDSSIPGVQVITSGPLPPNPAELLDSPQIATLIKQLRQQTDFVLIDTPAILTATDATVLAPLVDAVTLVVECAKVHEEAVQAARSQLVAVRAKLVGTVVNRSRNRRGVFTTAN